MKKFSANLKGIVGLLIVLAIPVGYMYMRGELNPSYWELEKWAWSKFYTEASILGRLVFVIIIGAVVAWYIHRAFKEPEEKSNENSGQEKEK